jgi:hypothetical protein
MKRRYTPARSTFLGRPISKAPRTEQALVSGFVAALSNSQTSFGDVRAAREFYYQRGRADVVAISADGEVLAFEAKLTRWRQALHQAFRNTCFAHRSYVVLPAGVASSALQYEREFQRRNVGLCAVNDERVLVLREAQSRLPLQPWLSGLAASHAAS